MWKKIKVLIISLLVLGVLGVAGYFVAREVSKPDNTYCMVYFDGRGGSLDEDFAFVEQGDTIMLPQIEREGYTFEGWFIGEEQCVEPIVVMTDMTLVAKWSPMKFTISFIVDGRQYNQQCQYGQTPVYEGSVAKAGSQYVRYEFMGWQPAIEKVTKNQVYTATYAEIYTRYNVELSSNIADAGEISGAGRFSYGTDISISAVANNGYFFEGWYNGETLYSSNSVLIINDIAQDFSLQARFGYESHSITYLNTKGATNVNPSRYNISMGNIVLADLDVDGYIFDGWYSDANGLGEKITSLSADMLIDYVLYAHFTPTVYNIKYNLDGGSVAVDNPLNYTIESNSFTLVKPEKEHYVFVGWRGTGITGTKQNVVVNMGSKGDREYTAVWEKAKYTITFIVEGEETQKQVEYGQMPEFGAVPTKPSSQFMEYVFTGWQPAITVAEQDAIYTAQFQGIVATFDVVLSSNMAEAGTISGAGTYTNADSFEIKTIVNPGYTFLGWYKAGELYSDAEAMQMHGIAEDLTLEARFEIITKTITYHDEGIAHSNPKSYTIKNNRIVLENLSKTGYIFHGWFTQSAGQGAKVESIECASLQDYTLYAYFEIINYTISYQLNGGIAVNPVSYNIESGEIVLVNPTKDYAEFLGWTGTGYSTPTMSITISAGTMGNLSFTAHWKEVDYTITYHDTKGAPNTNPSGFVSTSADIVLQGVSVTGYTFLGWYTQSGGMGSKVEQIVCSSPRNYDLYAHFELTNYTISYNLDGGVVSGTNPVSYNVESDDITLINPTKEHYSFIGWTEDGGVTIMSTATIQKGSTGDREFVAVWEVCSYNITFVINGNSEVKQFAYGDMPSYASTPTKPASTHERYEFAGWTPALATVIGDATYTAQFTTIEAEYNLYLSSSPSYGGSVTGGGLYKYNQSITISATPRSGYTFIAWYKNGILYSNTDTTVVNGLEANTSIIAKFEMITNRITYLDTKGALNPNPNGFDLESEMIVLQDIQVDGYTFKGWYSESNGSGTKIETIDPSTGVDHTVYAHFDIINYTISYNLDGGSVAGANPTSYNVESDDIVLVNPTKSHHTFMGWQENGTANTVENMTIVKGSFGDKIFTAVWNINSYNITFIVDGSSSVKTFTYGAMPSYGRTPTKPPEQYWSWEFAGWSPVLSSVTGDATYTAQFTKVLNKYNVSLSSDPAGAGVLSGGGQYEYNTTANISATENVGYEFVGWYKEGTLYSSDKNIQLTAISENIALVAKYNIITKTISYYDTMGASNPNPTSYDVTDGTITLQGLNVDYYTFQGWYTAANGGGTKIATIDCTTMQDYILYGYFTLTNYTITYNLSGGIATPANPTSYTIETPSFTLTNPSRDGYNFLGWTGTGVATTSMSVTVSMGSYGNRTYTAHWQANENTINFIVDGRVMDSIKAPTGTGITLPNFEGEDYDLTGYHVDEWYTTLSYTTRYTSTIMPANEITNLYGQWDYLIHQGFFEYEDEFDAFVTANTPTNKSSSNPLPIGSEEELLSWMEYVLYHDIMTMYYTKIIYRNFSSNDVFGQYAQRVLDVVTYQWIQYAGWTYNYLTNSFMFYIQESHADVECSKTADPGKNYIKDQQVYSLEREYTQVRSDSNDTFNVNNISRTTSVYSSTQLYYVLEKGIRPICETGSPAENVYNKAKAVLNKICDESMSDVEKAYAIYEWLALNVQYDYKALDYLSYESGWYMYDAYYAEGVFNNGVAVCDGIARSYLIMARIEGIPCIRQEGTNTSDGGGHAWNKIYIDGKWYGVDATHADAGWDETNYVTYTNSQFMFTDSWKVGQRYKTDNHLNIIANTIYNYYANAKFEYKGQEFDLEISSYQEFELLYNYAIEKLQTATSDYVTFEFTISSSFYVTYNSLFNYVGRIGSPLYFAPETTNGKIAYRPILAT